MKESRIKLSDNMISAVAKMSNGNPGAMTFMMKLITDAEKIDPGNQMGGLHSMLLADTFGIYGTDLYVLWSDICNRNTGLAMAMLTGAQLGIISGKLLADACSRQDYSGRDMIDVESVYKKVCEKVESFDKTLESL